MKSNKFFILLSTLLIVFLLLFGSVTIYLLYNVDKANKIITSYKSQPLEKYLNVDLNKCPRKVTFVSSFAKHKTVKAVIVKEYFGGIENGLVNPCVELLEGIYRGVTGGKNKQHNRCDSCNILGKQIMVPLKLTKKIHDKVLETAIWCRVPSALSYEEHFNFLFNNINMGTKDGCRVFGFPEASQKYFSKDLQDLSDEEIAQLFSIALAPSVLNNPKFMDRISKRYRKMLEELKL